jgi:histidine triad (HIT) family protein
MSGIRRRISPCLPSFPSDTVGRRVVYNFGWPIEDQSGIVACMDCIFCKIIDSSLPSWRVYEDEHAVAFLDKGHATRGHTLVVPRRHAADIWELSEAEAMAIMQSVHRVAHLLRDRLDLRGERGRGLNITQANGAAAWQEVFHYHVHLIPRYGDDNFTPPWRSTFPSDEQKTEIQRQILGETDKRHV